jgi:hypothetical protein
MNEHEARTVLMAELRKYRARSYESLSALIELPETMEITAASGAWYQLEFNATWNDEPNDVLRVVGMIDSGGPSARSPLTECFLVSSTGAITDV